MWQKLIDYFSPIRLCREWNESKLRANCTPGKELTGIAEPINAWSNLFYLFGGLFGLILGVTPESFVFAISMTSLAIGSFLYHAIPSRKSAMLDHFGIYAVFSTILLFALGAPWVIVAVISWGLAYKFSHVVETNLSVTTGVVGLSAFWAIGVNFYSVVGLFFIGSAFIFWFLDQRGWLVGRWGHGIWHTLTATGITFLFFAQ